MKQFSNYQYVGGEMSTRDKQEIGSKFWNEGKFNNFVKPFLPDDCSEQIFVDIGCNKGIFLRMAEEMGFNRVIGVDSNTQAISDGLKHKDEVGGHYEFIKGRMERVLDKLPVADYMVFANAHYYLPIDLWLDYLGQLKRKTRYVIIVTAIKRPVISKASADVGEIIKYFNDWEFDGFIDVPLRGDPYPRQLYGLCFKNPNLERISVDELNNGNHLQDGFYEELDQGKAPLETDYFKRLLRYRKCKWKESKTEQYTIGRVELYNSIKNNGLLSPLIVGNENRIYDGNHRGNMVKHLGYKSVIVRRV